MGSRRKRKHSAQGKNRILQHKISVLGISGVIVMLAVVLAVGSMSLREKNERYKAQQAELETQLEEQKARGE